MLGAETTRRLVCGDWSVARCSSTHAYLRMSVGSEQIDALAERIWQSVGPSGRNKVSVLSLGVSEA